MCRAVEMLGGGVLGFIAGTLLCAPLIAHVFGPVTVTWDASSCPPGVYTITSTASSLTDSRSFTAVTQHIRLPKASIIQEFGDLPVGQFDVTAVVRDVRGQTVGSGSQTVFGQGPSRGRQRTASYSIPEPYRPPVLRAPTAASSTATPSAQAAAVVPSPVKAVERASTVQRTRLSDEIRNRLRSDDGVLNLLAEFPWWKRVAFIDDDDDGVIDLIQIEWFSGEVWLATYAR